LWSLHFIEGQGNRAECVGLYQDNISTQLLIKNGRMSSGKKTKHIKAKFFFIKDRVDNGEIKVMDCPAGKMWADVLTKPLQEMAFRTMRAVLINCPVNYEDEEEKIVTKNTPHETYGNRTASKKMVLWKCPDSGNSHSPQECVGRS
jgi:hypothetical protein